MDFENSQFHYWDVFPKSVKVSMTGRPVTVPLSVRGTPTGQIKFESADSELAWIDENGRLNLGWQQGATMIMVYDSDDRESVRYVQVEVVDYGQSSGGEGYNGDDYEFPS
ncbi:MAG: hypothetical protein DRH50_10565 [Deltaproteobacteria bacterium]|nr:MAG: hypothetical protein DRH50_10565 [Deltaproteobacteria bacterium]